MDAYDHIFTSHPLQYLVKSRHTTQITAVLRVLATHGEDGINVNTVAEALSEELRRLATWLELDTIEISTAGSLHKSLRRYFAK